MTADQFDGEERDMELVPTDAKEAENNIHPIKRIQSSLTMHIWELLDRFLEGFSSLDFCPLGLIASIRFKVVTETMMRKLGVKKLAAKRHGF